MTINAPQRSRAMAAGCGAITLWGALATLSVLAGPVPPFPMVAMTFTLGAAIGILRARRRGLSWSDLLSWPPPRWLLGVRGLFGHPPPYFPPFPPPPPAPPTLA